jgi:hypothetical protein
LDGLDCFEQILQPTGAASSTMAMIACSGKGGGVDISRIPLVPGVPLKTEVAGVAMGLILEEDGRFVILTDILGSEDALGDMDFKVAGSADGVTAFQMDIKVPRSIKFGSFVFLNRGTRWITVSLDAGLATK